MESDGRAGKGKIPVPSRRGKGERGTGVKEARAGREHRTSAESRWRERSGDIEKEKRERERTDAGKDRERSRGRKSTCLLSLSPCLSLYVDSGGGPRLLSFLGCRPIPYVVSHVYVSRQKPHPFISEMNRCTPTSTRDSLFLRRLVHIPCMVDRGSWITIRRLVARPDPLSDEHQNGSTYMVIRRAELEPVCQSLDRQIHLRP